MKPYKNASVGRKYDLCGVFSSNAVTLSGAKLYRTAAENHSAAAVKAIISFGYFNPSGSYITSKAKMILV